MKVLSQIPGLFVWAGMDPADRKAATEAMWKSGRSAGAPWTFAEQPEATHGDEAYLKTANTSLVIPWIIAVLRQRVAPEPSALRVVTDRAGWLGNNQTREVAPYATFSGSKAEASWLPDEPTARGWQTVFGTAK